MPTTTPGLAVQLYSVRGPVATDLPATIGRLAAMGYLAVEPVLVTGASPEFQAFASEMAGDDALVPPIDPAELRTLLDDHGMVVSSAHTQLPDENNANAILDEQELLGNDLLIIPALFDLERHTIESFNELDSIKRWAERFNQAAQLARTRGMRVGYHNHFWEFGTSFDDRSGYDVFWDLVDPDVAAEVDVYWAYVGGRDPAEVVGALGTRVVTLHVKDGSGEMGSPQTAVGSGKLDIAAILGAATHAQWHIVELDECATDMFDALDDSARFLTDAGLSRGGRRR